MKGLTHLLLCSLATAAAAFNAAPSLAQTGKSYPMEGELTKAIHAAHAHVGDPVSIKLDRPWSSGACALARGAVLTGHITSVQPRSREKSHDASPAPTSSQLAIGFSVACGNGRVQPLTWIALFAPDDQSMADLRGGNPVTTPAMRSSSFGESGGISSNASQGNHADLSNRQSPNLPIDTAAPPEKAHERPAAVADGQVWRLPEIKMDVNAGPEGSTVLSSEKKDVRLPAGSVFILVTPRNTTPQTPAPTAAAPK